jgi:cobalt-zinc-cadmium efflux system outer membrane protein
MGLEIPQISYNNPVFRYPEQHDVEIAQIQALAVLREQPLYMAALHEYQATQKQAEGSKEQSAS